MVRAGHGRPAIAPLAFTSEDRVREVIHNLNADGFDSLYPRYAGGRPPKFSPDQRSEIKKIALGRPQDYGLPFSTWSLTKLAEHLVATGVVDDISHEGLRVLLREEGVSFQAVKTWKESNDPDSEAKKNRILELYDIADGKTSPCLMIRWWCSASTSSAPSTSSPIRASTGPASAATRPTPTGHRAVAGGPPTSDPTGSATYSLPMTYPPTSPTATSRRRRAGPSSWRSVATCARCIRSRCGSPSCSTTSRRTCRPRRTSAWASGRRPTTSSSRTRRTTRRWLNRIEAQFQALRYFCLDGTDHGSQREQASMIRRDIIWRNRNAQDRALRDARTLPDARHLLMSSSWFELLVSVDVADDREEFACDVALEASHDFAL